MKAFSKLIAVMLCGLWASNSQANNIALSNLSTNYNTSTGVVTAEFDLSWENSWRSSATGNWDAAWVFFKYKDNGLWLHLDLTGNDVSLPTGYTYTVPADKKGIFIYRDANGTGNVSLTDCIVGLKPVMGSFDIKAFALEMVMVPTGAFYVGDDNACCNSVYYSSIHNGYDFGPLLIGTGASSIIKGTGSASYMSCFFNGQSRNSYALGSNYPTGYVGFYIMKYELSNGAYRDYLNCYPYIALYWLPSFSVGSLVHNQGPNKILRIKTVGTSFSSPYVFGCDQDNDGIFDESNDGEWTACGGLDWADILIYLDWAALRPMTELEYEKACRGPNNPVVHEYAWGSAFTLNTGTPTIVNVYTTSEAITSSISYNCICDSSTSNQVRPIRSGALAKSTTTRSSSGASYWGVMDLTGNLNELCINAHDERACAFDGSHGDGLIWYLTVPTWHTGYPSTYIFRGGSYLKSYPVSGAPHTYPVSGTNDKANGIRGVRTLE